MGAEEEKEASTNYGSIATGRHAARSLSTSLTHNSINQEKSDLTEFGLVNESIQTNSVMGKLFPTGFAAEAKGTLGLAWGVILAQFSMIGMGPVATIFAGRLSKLELDAVALSGSIVEVTGITIILGMTTACDTLFSQTFGSGNKKRLGMLMQRSLIIHVITLLPIYAVQLNIEPILLLLGQNPTVAKLSAQYMVAFIPGMLSLAIFSSYIKVPMIIGFITIGINAICQYVFLYQFYWGVTGSGAAQAVSFTVMLILIIIYILKAKVYEDTWDGIKFREALEDWGEYFRFALFGTLMTVFEIWAFELTLFLGGILGTTELGAQSIAFNIDMLFYPLPSGMGTATSIRVGRFMGAGRPHAARTASRVGTFFVIGSSSVLVIVWALLRSERELPKIFTNNPFVPYMCMYVIFDNISAVSRGVMRGLGRQVVATIIIFIAYWLVALPIGIPLCFLTPLRMHGIWIGLVIALMLTAIMYLVTINCILNFDKIAREARVRARVVAPAETEKKTYEEEKKPLISSRDSDERNFREHEEEQAAISRIAFNRLILVVVLILIFVIGLVVRLSTDVTSLQPQNVTTEAFSNFTSYITTTVSKAANTSIS